MPDFSITKQAMAIALKKLCETKSFDKISISDITEYCGLNRQSFYYHFQDKYELLDWIYYHEGFILISNGITFDNWHQKLLELLHTMIKNKSFYINTLKSKNNIFHEYLFNITYTLFLEAAAILDSRNELDKEGRTFFSEFNAYGVCGVILSWAKDGMKIPPEKVSTNLKNLVINSKRLVLERFTQNVP